MASELQVGSLVLSLPLVLEDGFSILCLSIQLKNCLSLLGIQTRWFSAYLELKHDDFKTITGDDLLFKSS